MTNEIFLIESPKQLMPLLRNLSAYAAAVGAATAVTALALQIAMVAT